MGAMPVMLDVDTGIDDTLALALACATPEIDLVAVSTVAGNVPIEATTRNTLDVLAFLGSDNVPVYRGASRPLARPLQSARHVHGANGIGGASLPRATRKVERTKGPATMVRLAQERPRELTLVCLGPLTNLAIALNVEPGLPELLRSVVVMGGAYWIEGNYTRAAEFNFYIDPEAAAQVFAAPFRHLVTVSLDMTHKAPIPPKWWERASAASAPAQRLFHMVFRSAFEDEPEKPHYMHDAMAFATVVDPSLFTTERHAVVIYSEHDERGASRLAPSTVANVAVDVDVDRFLALMQGILVPS